MEWNIPSLSDQTLLARPCLPTAHTADLTSTVSTPHTHHDHSPPSVCELMRALKNTLYLNHSTVIKDTASGGGGAGGESLRPSPVVAVNFTPVWTGCSWTASVFLTVALSSRSHPAFSHMPPEDRCHLRSSHWYRGTKLSTYCMSSMRLCSLI